MRLANAIKMTKLPIHILPMNIKGGLPEVKHCELILQRVSSSSIVEFACPIKSLLFPLKLSFEMPLKEKSSKDIEEALTSMNPQQPSKTFQTLMIQDLRNRIFC